MPGSAADVETQETEHIEELSGKLSFQQLDDKLMHLVLENDESIIEKGKIVSEALDNSMGAITVDLLMENLTRNYSWAQKLFGPRLLKALTTYDPAYLESNIRIPEFQRELKSAVARRIEAIKKEGLLDKEGSITEKGIELASLLLFIDELRHLKAHSFGEREDPGSHDKRPQPWVKPYHHERYRDISIKKTLHTALRRGHRTVLREDLRVHLTKPHGELHVMYALDASGSMKGDKMRNAKRAGIALAFRALEEKNKVGLLAFSNRSKKEVPCSSDFPALLHALASIKASEETDLALAIHTACTLFPKGTAAKHLILLTDSLPTVGQKPIEETLQQVSIARSQGITISLIGLNLSDEGKKLSEQIVELGEGRLYAIRDFEKLDTIVLEDYEHTI